ncbi:hypothetical protein [Flagellimonas meishanensis]|uniref:hypothetical protein n=1 Tax=Flagellimonas meishanensis TaxID=2873264 RepID=UPI001CA770B5|nr:hypothetical protein [[Muricauda] meishanensis]
MDNNDTFIFAAGGLLNGIAHVLVIAACVVLMIKRKSGPTLLMLASQLLALIFFIGSFLWTTFSARQGTEELVRTSKIIAALGPLPHLLFALGLLWFAVQLSKRKEAEE